jgi:release factor glutamine methyltransferase
MTIGAALHQATETLKGASPTPRVDAEALAMHALGLSRAELIIRAAETLGDTRRARFSALIARRLAGEPVAYLTGSREFWSLPLKVTPATLIPRPETELLVERALARIPRDAGWRIADLGTGSGAVALAIACERPRCRVIATDISADALEVARDNARAHGIANVEFRQGHWLGPLGGERYDLIVSNPPYVRAADPHLTAGDLRFEPRTALAAGPDGLNAIRAIAAAARRHLREGGFLLLEHGHDQGPSVGTHLCWYGYGDVATHRDLAGHERVTEARAAA